MNTIEVTSNYNEQLHFDNTTTIKMRIPRNGDLINNLFIKLDLPNFYSEYTENGGFKLIDNISSSIIKSIKFMIEDTVIENLTGEFIYLYQNLYNKKDKQNIIDSISGNTKEFYNPTGKIDNNYRAYTNNKTTDTGNYLNKHYNKNTFIKDNVIDASIIGIDNNIENRAELSLS